MPFCFVLSRVSRVHGSVPWEAPVQFFCIFKSLDVNRESLSRCGPSCGMNLFQEVFDSMTKETYGIGSIHDVFSSASLSSVIPKDVERLWLHPRWFPLCLRDSFWAAVFLFSFPCHCRTATLCHHDAPWPKKERKADELARAGAMLDAGFMAEVRGKTVQHEREDVYAALQYAASFHCSVEESKDCEEIWKKAQYKWIVVDKKSKETKHGTECCT